MNITLKVAHNQVLRSIENEKSLSNLEEIAAKYVLRIERYSKPKSLKGRVQEYKLMRETAKAITLKIHQSRTWVQWFLSWFGVGVGKSEANLLQAQKQLTILITRSQIEEAELWLPPNSPKIPIVESDWMINLHYNLYGVDLYDKRIKPYIDEVHRINRQFITDHEARMLKDPTAQVKMAAFNLCGTNELNGTSVEGMSSHGGMYAFITQLKGFIEENKARLNLEQSSRLENVLRKLEYTLKVSEKLELIRHFQKPQLFEELAYEIAEDIQNLEVNDSLILPGGYRNKTGGHATLFEFERYAPSNYAFNIVNTGSGALAFAGFGDYVGALVNNKVQDYRTSGHTLLKASDTAFIKELLMNAHVNPDGSVESMFKPIIQHFLKGNPKSIEKGKEHFLQTNGTCAFDCVVAWAEGEMGETLAKLFQLYRVNSGLRDLNSLKEHSIKHIQASIPGLFDNVLTGMELTKKLKEWGSKRFNDLKGSLSRKISDKIKSNESCIKEQNEKLKKANQLKGETNLTALNSKILEIKKLLDDAKNQAKPLEDAHNRKMISVIRPVDEPLQELRDRISNFEKILKPLEDQLKKYLKGREDEVNASASIKKAEAKVHKYKSVQTILNAV